ncbi:AMP-binding protein [Embleya hyalina]|uniref:Benzoate--CoA ligase n=1 Tax=Embleya hyalina TaxID=516124 RepID=A0A401YM87_9ACTN|nr:AMP-binding protein [Embleya hyalina]GCD95734.1 benzoate--CoA ligase [Embleya hyalina]
MNPVDLLLLRHIAAGRGDRTSLVDRAGTMTYTELAEAASEYAGTLAAGGIRPGARALVVSDDTADAVVAVLGLWWHGCVPVVLGPMLRDAELAFIARDCAAEYADLDLSRERRDALSAALGPVALRHELRDSAAEFVEPGAPAAFAEGSEVLVQYTSGSTGRPRGVRHSMSGIRAVLTGFGGVLALTEADTVLSTAKLSFGYGFGNSLLFPLAAGACSALLAGPVDAFTVITAIHRYRPTVLCAVPRVYESLLSAVATRGAAPDTSRVRLAVAAGEHLPADLARRATEGFGFPLVNGFGATEVLHIVLATAAGAPPRDSTGVPVSGVTATVRDDHGRPVPTGTHGRLHIVSASAALGYIDRPEAQAGTFADGGVYPGDVVYRTPDGDFRHVCRTDDLLNIGGHKVAPAEIEALLKATDGIADCAVVADRDPAGLQQAVAYVVSLPGAAPEEVRRSALRAIRDGLPPHRRPSRIEPIDTLPTTSTGKLARHRLRTPEEAR